MIMSRFSFVLSVTLIALNTISSNATCNLLESGNGAYIDTESKSSIETMCAGDVSALSLWEQYQCEYIQNRAGYERCWPQRRMSLCAPGSLKGAIFLYHGYSACPDQYNDIAPKLQAECWNVYLILTIGHGYDYCTDNSTDSGCTASMYNLTALPNTRQPYIDYVNKMILAINDEVSIIKECELAANTNYNTDDMEVVVGGLSFGAPLSAATVVLSGTDSIFTKHIIMSPFFGVSVPSLDQSIYKCLLNTNAFQQCLPTYFKSLGYDIDDENANALTDMVVAALSYYVDLEFLDNSFETIMLMVRKIIEWVVENPNAIDDPDVTDTVNDALDTVIGWGAQCELDILYRNRGGFCQFSVRNLAASHSFSQYVLDTAADTESIDVETLLIMVERDGPTRNALAAEYVSLLYNGDTDMIYNKATDCMWFISAECQQESYIGPINNECGVPHSSMANADNEGIPPYNLYWNATYHNGLIDWINDETDFGDDFIVKTAWDESRNQCVYLDLIDPPSSLVADVPRLTRIGLKIVGDTVTEKITDTILNSISGLTGVPRGILELTYSLISDDGTSDTDNDYYEFTVSLDGDSGDLMESLLDNDAVGDIANYSVEYVQIGGNQYEPTTTTDAPATTDDGDDESTTDLMFSTTGDDESGINRLKVGKWIISICCYILIIFA